MSSHTSAHTQRAELERKKKRGTPAGSAVNLGLLTFPSSLKYACKVTLKKHGRKRARKSDKAVFVAEDDGVCRFRPEEATQCRAELKAICKYAGSNAHRTCKQMRACWRSALAEAESRDTSHKPFGRYALTVCYLNTVESWVGGGEELSFCSWKSMTQSITSLFLVTNRGEMLSNKSV